MTHHRADWLERLALRSLSRPVQASRGYEPAVEREARFSRGAAFKLTLAGAAALSLGLGRAPAARAQDRGACFTECLKSHDDELYSRRISCRDVFGAREFKNSEAWSAKRFSRLFSFGGERDLAFAGVVLEALCNQKAEHEVRRDKNDCYKGCEQGCRSRRVQSASSSAGHHAPSCEVTPPHKAPPPEIPTPPNPDSDVCLVCSGAGNQCCPGGSIEAGGMCACAPPEVPCSYYEGNCA